MSDTQYVLLNPGPCNVSDRVRTAIAGPDMCHRERDFADILLRVRAKIIQALEAGEDYTALCITGSGTAALELAVLSSLSEGRKMLVIDNGVYGDRIATIARRGGLEVEVLTYPWGVPPDLAAIEACLKSDGAIEVVACVHHETTTGLLNPIPEIGALTREYGKIFLVDSISGMAGDELKFKEWNIALTVGTANKCLHGLPGLAFVVLRKDQLERIAALPKRSLYFDLYNYYLQQEKGEVPFTPAVQVFFALEAALDELIAEGINNRVARYKKRALRLRQGFSELGLEFLLAEVPLSNTLTSLKLPEGLDYNTLHDALKEKGFVIYAGQGGLSKSAFRIANLGEVADADFERFLAELKALLREKGIS